MAALHTLISKYKSVEAAVFVLVLVVGILSGIFLRFYHIEFGLPHSFYADEPEIAEPAIKYTYEIRSIIARNDYYKLIPVSYVYGAFPTYLFTAATTLFSKTLGVAHISFEKMDIYIFQRSVTALISFSIAPVVALLYYKLFKNRLGAVITFFLALVNWKMIVHAHYVNADILVTALLALSFLTFHVYFTRKGDTKYTLLTGILFGLAVGTKITTLLTLPLYLFVFATKRELRNALAFVFVALGAFIVTNPFSLIFSGDFVYRIYEMFFKEAGLVFDSVDTNPFKYVITLSYITTLPVFLLSLYGAVLAVRKNTKSAKKVFHIFLTGNVVFYLVFYSLQSRLVDRWLLPILPLVILYAAAALIDLSKRWQSLAFKALLVGSALYVLFFPIMLLFQFQRNTPKSAAYIWAQQNLPITSTKLTYTEEGLDPTNKLTWAKTVKVPVYASEGAQYYIPDNPLLYDYVILSSRPMQNYKRPAVRKAFPFYYEHWKKFEDTTLNPTKFELIKEFSLPKPNLIPLSDVFIYKNLRPIVR